MAGSVKESGYREIVLRRGEDRSIKFIYRPRDRSLPPFDISGQTVVLKVKAKGAAEQTFGSPECDHKRAGRRDNAERNRFDLDHAAVPECGLRDPAEWEAACLRFFDADQPV